MVSLGSLLIIALNCLWVSMHKQLSVPASSGSHYCGEGRGVLVLSACQVEGQLTCERSLLPDVIILSMGSVRVEELQILCKLSLGAQKGDLSAFWDTSKVRQGCITPSSSPVCMAETAQVCLKLQTA